MIISSEIVTKASQEVIDSVEKDLEKEQNRSISSLLHEEETTNTETTDI